MTPREAALAYAHLGGWRTFQTAADCRTPLVGPGFSRGVHDATRDPAELMRRFRYAPKANLSLACGDGLLALDVDRKGEVDGFVALAELEAEFKLLPKTVRSRTPSGGEHLLFRYQGASPPNRGGIKRWNAAGERRVYAGLDVRAAGASIALPPSERQDGTYTWEVWPQHNESVAPAPAWLLALLRSEPPPRPPAPPLRMHSLERMARYVEAAVNRECADLAACRAPGRNVKLFQAAANLGELVGAHLLPQDMAEAALERAAGECGLIAEDGLHGVRASIASGMRKGMANPREVAA